MPTVKPIKMQGSLGFGQGAAKAQPARTPMPVTSKPDRVDPRDQTDYLSDLKAGVSSNKPVHHNPGKK